MNVCSITGMQESSLRTHKIAEKLMKVEAFNLSRLGHGSSAAQSLEYLTGGDDLAGVPLRMIGDMDQRAAGAGGQLLAANAP